MSLFATAVRSGDADRAEQLARNYARRSPFGLYGVVELFDPAEIFERDEWTCHVCLEPVDGSVWRGRMRPTIDHLIPVNRDGLHSRTNVALAHQGCNSSRHRKAA